MAARDRFRNEDEHQMKDERRLGQTWALQSSQKVHGTEMQHDCIMFESCCIHFRLYVRPWFRAMSSARLPHVFRSRHEGSS